jgi:aminopeptidase YwaD
MADVGLELIERLGVEIGPRLAGSDAARRGAEAVADAVRTLGIEPRLQEFDLLGYVPEEPELEVAGERWDAAPCTWAHPSPPEGLRGRARRIGTQVVIPGMVSAPAFTIEDEQGRQLGQLYGNPFGGPAIPLVSGYGQLLTMPSAWISAADAERLERLGTTEVRLRCGGEFRSGLKERNVLAELPGDSDETVIVCAHLDTVRGAPGLIDNASGAQAVLELLRRFRDRPRPRGLLACFFAAEEIGLLGSRFFVLDRKLRGELDRITAVVNLDCVARGESMLLMGDPEWTRTELETAAGELGLASRNEIQVGPLRAGSDHLPFALEGIPAAWVTHWPYSEYHTDGERMELVDEVKLADAVALAERVVERLLAR